MNPCMKHWIGGSMEQYIYKCQVEQLAEVNESEDIYVNVLIVCCNVIQRQFFFGDYLIIYITEKEGKRHSWEVLKTFSCQM